MPRAKYADIYRDLKTRIETGEYEFQELLPSENHLIQTYNCSRNTLRRAVSTLVTDGYVQTMQGKGVRNIYRPAPQTTFYHRRHRIFPGVRHPQSPDSEDAGPALCGDHRRPESLQENRIPCGRRALLSPAAPLPGRQAPDPESQLFSEGSRRRTYEGDRGIFHLRLSGAGAGHGDRDQQAGDDHGEDDADR